MLYLQGELMVGDQSGTVHIWNLRTGHNEQLVRNMDRIIQCICILVFISLRGVAKTFHANSQAKNTATVPNESLSIEQK